MSVLLETSVGDIVLDLEVDKAPRTCDNFLKLCAIKYYNDCTFHTVQRDHSVQTGDPTNTGTGGQSIHALLAAAADTKHAGASAVSLPPSTRFLQDEIDPTLTHVRAGTVGMSNLGIPNSAASQFYITTAPGLHSLDKSHTVFGHVAEGMEAVERLNAAVTDERGRPTVHIRIRHAAVLDDPFPMPYAVAALVPPNSPPPVNDPYDYENINGSHTDDSRAADPATASSPAINPHAVVLEMIGDLPSADIAPPENILFVCKLNPITQDDDLQLIFSRFGPIVDCSIVRDNKTRQSLGYAFIEYERKEDCEAAYVKMDNVLIDDRRIRVDFSQSVSRQWRQFKNIRRSANTQRTNVAALQVRQQGGEGVSTAARGDGPTTAAGSEGRKSRWGDSRSQLAAVSSAEERKERPAVEGRGREKDRLDEVRVDEENSSRERRHPSERRHRSRERSAERSRREYRHSRSRSRSRERHKRSHREKHRDSRERDSDRQKKKDRHRDSRDRDTPKDRERHRHSRSPRRRHH